MSSLEAALSVWLLFLSNLDVDAEHRFLPPASRAEIAQVEETIAFELPDDFIQLYLIANGQSGFHEGRKNFTGAYCPLFGFYELISLDKVLSNYQEQLAWYERELPDIFEADARLGDPVAAVGWQPGWVPFAAANAAYYAVDLSPVRGGTCGQVIEYGHDTIENRVMASSISEFLTLASKMLDPEEPYRYFQEPENPANEKITSLVFDMDWRQTPQQPHNTEYQQDPEMVAWNGAHQAAVVSFLAWLENKGYSSDERDAFESWTYEMNMPFSLPSHLLGPPMPHEAEILETYSDPLNMLVSLEMAPRELTTYTIEALPVSLEQAFTLLHSYRVEMGEWSQQQFDAATDCNNQ